MEVTNKIKAQIYRAYIKADGKNIPALAKKFDMSRQAIYQHIRSVRTGERNLKIEREIKVATLWETRYKFWYKALPKKLTTETGVKEYKNLIKEMKHNGFTLPEIGKLLGKDHTTIGYHVNKK
jgi:predicted DNA-binding protein YlxM (UPF0122 family)